MKHPVAGGGRPPCGFSDSQCGQLKRSLSLSLPMRLCPAKMGNFRKFTIVVGALQSRVDGVYLTWSKR